MVHSAASAASRSVRPLTAPASDSELEAHEKFSGAALKHYVDYYYCATVFI